MNPGDIISVFIGTVLGIIAVALLVEYYLRQRQMRRKRQSERAAETVTPSPSLSNCEESSSGEKDTDTLPSYSEVVRGGS